MSTRLDPPPMRTRPPITRALDRPHFYRVLGVVPDDRGPVLPRIDVRPIGDGGWEPREHTAGVAAIRLEVHAYGDDTTTVFASVAGTDLGNVIATWRNLTDLIPTLLHNLWKDPAS